MKKILKLLFVLSGTTTLPLTVIACGQESLDDNLNIIRNDYSKYNINELLDIDIANYQKTFSLSLADANELAKSIANQILSKSDIKITWKDDTPKENEKCYHFIIINGSDPDEEEQANDPLTWTVNKINGRFTIQIRYWVGTVNQKQEFVAHQQIDKSFEIKTYNTLSDRQVKKWVSEFNNKNWDQNNPLMIDLKSAEIDLPAENTSWSDLDEKVIQKINNTIISALKDFETQNVAWTIQSTKSSITEQKLKLKITANKGETKKDTDEFFILFK